LRVRGFVVDFEAIERCCILRIEPEFPDLFSEELALFPMIIEAA